MLAFIGLPVGHAERAIRPIGAGAPAIHVLVMELAKGEFG